MARPIILGLDGETSTFDFEKVDRDKLYGRKERIIVDEKGEPCFPALLTSDGAALVPSGGAAYLYLDANLDTYERSALVPVDTDGKRLPPVPSTLGVEQPLKLADARRVLDHVTLGIYQLSPTQIGSKLAAALEAGSIFETRFNYRDDAMDSPAFVLKNEHGAFLLVCAPIDFTFVAKEAPPDAEPDTEETLGDELDFSMM
jgi:hypothetical protein